MTPTRSDFPRWRLPFPTLPTISGKRRASREERERWLAGLRAQRTAAWLRSGTRHTLAEYSRLQRLAPEEAATDGAQLGAQDKHNWPHPLLCYVGREDDFERCSGSLHVGKADRILRCAAHCPGPCEAVHEEQQEGAGI